MYEKIISAPNPVIVGEIVTLKLLNEAYFEEYCQMFSPVVRKAIGLSEVVNFEETTFFLEKKVEALHAGKIVNYCIFENVEGILIGGIEIREFGYRGGQLRAWINEEYWGSGRYQESLDLILQEYFTNTDQKEINAYVPKDNVRSLNAHTKYGFEVVKEFEENDKFFYELVIKKMDTQKNESTFC